MDVSKYINHDVVIIYEDMAGRFTRRTVKVITVTANKVSAYDLAKRAPRSLHPDRILACRPVPSRERGVS
ncbi:hypothetical protein [Cohnella sp. JJ-181]|uniref:hypothetical protein n=1 Tax=Cohnella rhizoplanae TaxID=2974897 RepID=UPI0022FFAABD|nr:hypothetical protein [Cohnella sp. JJ-181]CAI6079368.1 hypothetical protein COHCIP112018_02757 [Cohnella sp. JJ-181]